MLGNTQSHQNFLQKSSSNLLKQLLHQHHLFTPKLVISLPEGGKTMKKEDESQYAHRHNTLCKLSLSLNVVLVVLSFYNGSSFCVGLSLTVSSFITSFSSLLMPAFQLLWLLMTLLELLWKALRCWTQDGNYILSFALLDPFLSSFSFSFFKCYHFKQITSAISKSLFFYNNLNVMLSTSSSSEVFTY